MKKLLSSLCLALICSTHLFAYDYCEIDGIHYGLDQKNMTAEVGWVDIYQYIDTLIIPSSITYDSQSYIVTAIGDSAIGAPHSSTKSVPIRIPYSITTIGSIDFVWIDVDEANTHYASIDGALYNYAKDTLIKYPRYHSRTEYTIPNSVTTIGEGALFWCYSLTSITLGNSVTTIGENIFYCNGLISIDVDAANTHYCSIDGVLFNYAKDTLIQYPKANTRTKYTIPNSVTTIGSYAFEYCSGLTSVTIGNSVTTIKDYAFSNCRSLTSVTIGNSVTTIGNRAFYECTDLTSVSIGNSVTTIGEEAFCDCRGLTSVTIPNSVTWIEYQAFSCRDLTSITCEAMTPPICGAYCFSGVEKSIPVYVPAQSVNAYKTAEGWKEFTNIQGIGDIKPQNNIIIYEATAKLPETTSTYSSGLHTNAFNVAITSHDFSNGTGTITFAGEVTTIGNRAFYYCEGLTSITIPNSVTTIGDYAFYNCNSLTSITIPNSVTSIGEEAFSYCKGLTSITIPNSVTTIGKGAFYNCNSLTSITIPNSVTSIGEEAFSYCKGLTSITIPNSVTTIGDGAFEECSGLTSIDVDAANIHYASIDGVLFNYAKDTLIQYPIGNPRAEYIIPNSVTTIGEWAFYYCTGLTSITIPNSVTTIGEWTFAWCSGLTSVTIGNSVTTIGGHTFSDCSGLTSITIPNSVTTIGEWAFAFCSGLTSVTIGNSVTTIGWGAFDGCKGLTSVTIPNSVTTIGNNAFFDCAGLTSVTIGNSVTTIGSWAFSGCSGLTSITIPNSVTYIGSSAFYGCSGLTSVTIPNSVTSIGNSAFRGCSGLATVTCEATTPPTCGDWCFDAVDKSIPLFVPAGSVDAYKTAEGWKEFTNIQGLSCIVASGTCGIEESCFTWKLTCDSVLTISENCETSNNIENAPWKKYEDMISTLIVNAGVADIPPYFVTLAPNLKTIYWNTDEITYWSDGHRWCSLEEIVFGDSVTHVPQFMCYNANTLKKVTLSETITSIGSQAFYGCGIMIPIYNTHVFAYMPHSYQGSYSIPAEIESIASSAFEFCSTLSSITIPNSVTTIGEWAFAWCSGLTSVTIGNSVTTIGWGAFDGCKGLTSITIPNSVTTIGSWAFSGCSGLTSITCEATTPPACVGSCFYDVDKSIPLYVPAGSVDAYKASGWKEFTNIIGICEGDPYFIEQDTTICGRPYPFVWEGDTVRYGGEVWHWGNSWSWYNHVDTVTRNYISVGGCDSILQLVVYYPGYQYELINDTIEEGQSHWSEYTETGIYYKRYPNVYGCDSMVLELHLVVIPKPIYMVTLSVNNAKYGSVEGSGAYNKGDTVILVATPNKGYQFNQWSDGVTTNPRTIYNIDKDYTLTAQFGIKQCSWLVESNDLEMGAVYTDFTNEYYNYGIQITVEASANSGYKFVKWNDGKKYNPYKFSILEDKYLLAIFMAEEEEMDTTQVQPSDTTATFTWPFIVGGFTYTLTIYLDAACTIPFCTLTFNQYGQLTGITFGSRVPRRSAMANQEEEFTTTINGLSAGTEYFYKMETKDKDGKLLNTDEGGFSTQNSGVITNTEKVEMSIQGGKFIKDNQLYIFRGDKIYTATGQNVK